METARNVEAIFVWELGRFQGGLRGSVSWWRLLRRDEIRCQGFAGAGEDQFLPLVWHRLAHP